MDQARAASITGLLLRKTVANGCTPGEAAAAAAKVALYVRRYGVGCLAAPKVAPTPPAPAPERPATAAPAPVAVKKRSASEQRLWACASVCLTVGYFVACHLFGVVSSSSALRAASWAASRAAAAVFLPAWMPRAPNNRTLPTPPVKCPRPRCRAPSPTALNAEPTVPSPHLAARLRSWFESDPRTDAFRSRSAV
jgi:hypothetical protein